MYLGGKLSILKARKDNPTDLYFCPSGKVHHLHRERLLILFGGQRALLMQVANPLVAQGVLDHSTLRNKSFERLNRTLSMMQSFTFGTNEDVEKISARINHAHSFVNGKLTKNIGSHAAGTSYSAFDPELLMWVWATLVDTTVLVYETFINPLSDEDKEAYYQEVKRLLPPLGGNIEQTPATFDHLRSYLKTKYSSDEIAIDNDVKQEIIPYLLLQKPKRLKLPLLPLSLPLAKVAVGLLPDELRKQYGLSWTKRDQKFFNYFAAASRKIHSTQIARLIPDQVRYSTHYRQIRSKNSKL